MSYAEKSRLDLCGDYFVRKPDLLLRNPKQFVHTGLEKRERGAKLATKYTKTSTPSSGLFGRRSELWFPFMPFNVSPTTVNLDYLRREPNEQQRSRWLRREDAPWSPPTYIQQYTPGSHSHYELESNLIRTSRRFQHGAWKSNSSTPRFQHYLWSN